MLTIVLSGKRLTNPANFLKPYPFFWTASGGESRESKGGSPPFSFQNGKEVKKSMSTQQIILPKEVEDLISVVSERWGYYFGKRAIMGELMSATKKEIAAIKALNKKISEKINEYAKDGKDVRSEIKALQAELEKAREAFKQKSEQYYAKLKPLNKALSYLDKIVIPSAIEAVTKEKIMPRYQVSEDLMKVIEQQTT